MEDFKMSEESEEVDREHWKEYLEYRRMKENDD